MHESAMVVALFVIVLAEVTAGVIARKKVRLDVSLRKGIAYQIRWFYILPHLVICTMFIILFAGDNLHGQHPSYLGLLISGAIVIVGAAGALQLMSGVEIYEDHFVNVSYGHRRLEARFDEIHRCEITAERGGSKATLFTDKGKTCIWDHIHSYKTVIRQLMLKSGLENPASG